MENKTLENPIQPAWSDRIGKTPYVKPVLRSFGSVGELTKGGSGSFTDSNKSSNANPNHRVHGL